ncbi:MAG: hypothetical protein K8R87_03285 [Verrucomicrobia bacterium]|nr:hypothetical protein [Verrucomicrobiota bacterium]
MQQKKSRQKKSKPLHTGSKDSNKSSDTGFPVGDGGDNANTPTDIFEQICSSRETLMRELSFLIKKASNESHLEPYDIQQETLQFLVDIGNTVSSTVNEVAEAFPEKARMVASQIKTWPYQISHTPDIAKPIRALLKNLQLATGTEFPYDIIRAAKRTGSMAKTVAMKLVTIMYLYRVYDWSNIVKPHFIENAISFRVRQLNNEIDDARKWRPDPYNDLLKAIDDLRDFLKIQEPGLTEPGILIRLKELSLRLPRFDQTQADTYERNLLLMIEDLKSRNPSGKPVDVHQLGFLPGLSCVELWQDSALNGLSSVEMWQDSALDLLDHFTGNEPEKNAVLLGGVGRSKEKSNIRTGMRGEIKQAIAHLVRKSN